jgi:hypothetical protein
MSNDLHDLLPDRVDRIGYRMDALRLVPTIGMTGYGVFAWQVGSWFMSLPDPSGAQAAFVSTIFAVAPLVLGLFQQTALDWSKRMRQSNNNNA